MGDFFQYFDRKVGDSLYNLGFGLILGSRHDFAEDSILAFERMEVFLETYDFLRLLGLLSQLLCYYFCYNCLFFIELLILFNDLLKPLLCFPAEL